MAANRLLVKCNEIRCRDDTHQAHSPDLLTKSQPTMEAAIAKLPAETKMIDPRGSRDGGQMTEYWDRSC